MTNLKDKEIERLRKVAFASSVQIELLEAIIVLMVEKIPPDVNISLPQITSEVMCKVLNK